MLYMCLYAHFVVMVSLLFHYAQCFTLNGCSTFFFMVYFIEIFLL